MKRRLLSALLAMAMLLTMAPTVAFAASGDDEGAVSSNSIYEIRNDTQLRTACAVGGIYKLANDVEIQETVKIEKSIQLDFDNHSIKQTGNGGVIRIESAIPTDVINVKLKNGTITGGNDESGAGVFIIRGADVTIRNCVITGNTATGVGGAIHQATHPNNSNTCTLVNTRVTNNSATSGGGISLGAAHFQYDNVTSTLKLEDGTVIEGNSATKDGGAIYLVGNGSRFEMNGAEITDNHSGENGGGIYSTNWRGLSINSGKITGNSAQNGGGIYIQNVYPTLNPLEDEVLTVGAGTVITDNTAKVNGGGISASNGVTVNVAAGAALYNNTAVTMADDLYSSEGAVTLPAASQMSGDRLLKSDNVTITGWYYDGREPGDIQTKRWSSYVKGALDVDETMAQGKPVYGEDSYFYKEYAVTLNDDTSLLTLKAAHGEAPEWDTSKSKTATNLEKQEDDTYTSDVTLSLPSAEEMLESDIVFVVDKSSSSRAESTDQGVAMLEDLNDAISTTNATINVGIIVFDGSAHLMRELSAYDANDIKQKMSAEIPSEEVTGGTNMEAGLLAAKDMLEADTDVPDNRKHVIVVSDGLTRLFTAEDGKTTQIIFNEQHADRTTYFGDYTTWCLSNGFSDGEYKIPGAQTWLQYYNSTIKPQVEADGDMYVMAYDGDNTKNTPPEKYIKYNDIQNHAQAVDRAFYDAYNAYLNLSSKYQCYAVYTGNSELGNGFMSTLNNNATVDFDSIYDGIYYLLDAGSKVVDVIGEGTDNHSKEYNFDFVDDAASLILTVGGNQYTATAVTGGLDNGETACYNFTYEDVTATNGAAAPFVLHYYKDGTTVEGTTYGECFVWDINVPVSNFAPVQLTYTVKLTDPQTGIGTYGEYDEDGLDAEGKPLNDEGRSLFTNKSATLYPVDSNGAHGVPENFGKPTVSYTVGADEDIIIEPADITIYTGGEDYSGIVDAAGDPIESTETTTGLPEPGYHFTLPQNVIDWLQAKTGNTTSAQNLSKYLTFQYDVTDKTDNHVTRNWGIEYVGVYATDDEGNPTQYVYRMLPGDTGVEGQNPIPVRLVYFDDRDENGTYDETEVIDTDDITMGVDLVSDTYKMTINPGELDQNQIKAVLQVGSESISCDVRIGTGDLLVKSTTNAESTNTVKASQNEVTGDVITAVDNGEVTYYVNESEVTLEGDRVRLLVDEVSNSTEFDAEMGSDAMSRVQETSDMYNLSYDTAYMDLVDTQNGNAVLTMGDGDKLTIYWPAPSNAAPDSEYRIVHYTEMDRMDVTGTENLGSADTDIQPGELVNLNGNNYIKFEVSSFSPFVLVWEANDNGGSSGGGGNNKPDDLNTEDHFAYIIGYPKDYRTGEPTDDESLWPVEPQGDITRAEVATIFFRMLTDEARDRNWSQTNSYTDVDPSDWYNNAISTLSNMGIISGDPSGAFRPDDSITRAEFTKIAVGFFDKAGDYVDGTYDDVSSSDWYADFIDAAVDLGLIEGYPDGTIRPEATITRAEACTIVNRTLGRVPDKDHLLPADEMRVWPDNSDTNEWYYAQIQEATNSHDYEWIGEENDQIENWTEKLEDRDWAQLEREWSDANSAPGGEVVD